MSERPLWLESSEVLSLLNMLVDRLDYSAANGTRTQSIALTERTWPALFKQPYESRKEALWEHIGQMCEWGWMEVKPAVAAKSRSGYDHMPRVSVRNEEALRKVTGRPERVKSSVERWREAVHAKLDASDEVRRLVGEFCIDIPGHDMTEVVQQLNLLAAMANRPLLLREVSAMLFWGLSKVLDKRQALVAAILGLEECPFPEAPVQLQVFLPETTYQGVLFIENLMSFEQALRSGSKVFEGLVLVYASGFKGSAQRLRSPAGRSLFYSSQGQLGGAPQREFEDWLGWGSALPAHFWGDLDYAGMRILAALRGTFPELGAWQPGYSPMLKALVAGQGHSPEAADKQGQKALNKTGCPYADAQLIPAIEQTGRYVDQELFAL